MIERYEGLASKYPDLGTITLDGQADLDLIDGLIDAFEQESSARNIADWKIKMCDDTQLSRWIAAKETDEI